MLWLAGIIVRLTQQSPHTKDLVTTKTVQWYGGDLLLRRDLLLRDSVGPKIRIAFHVNSYKRLTENRKYLISSRAVVNPSCRTCVIPHQRKEATFRTT